MFQPLIDHRGPQFAALLSEVIEGLKNLFKTAQGQILLFPGSGTGGWECCVVNTLSPGHQVLGCVNGHFSDLYCRTAASHGVNVQRLEVEYGATVPAGAIEERLRLDKERQIKAVLVVQTETSTGVTSSLPAVRHAIDAQPTPPCCWPTWLARWDARSLSSTNGDSTSPSTATQKGLMLPPGMALLAVSEKALLANQSAKCGRSFWDWRAVLWKATPTATFHTPRQPPCSSA